MTESRNIKQPFADGHYLSCQQKGKAISLGLSPIVALVSAKDHPPLGNVFFK
jgi:hypothetical protein